MKFTVNKKTGTYHQDPGCSRIFVNTTPKTRKQNFVDVDRLSEVKLPRGVFPKRCFYCFSEAGYRRLGRR